MKLTGTDRRTGPRIESGWHLLLSLLASRPRYWRFILLTRLHIWKIYVPQNWRYCRCDLTLPWFLFIFEEADIFAESLKRHQPTDRTSLSRWIRPCPNEIVIQLRHWPNKFVPVTGAIICQRTSFLGQCLKEGQSCWVRVLLAGQTY